MDVKVLKFGGSILKDREDFGLVAGLISSELEGGVLPLPVVSAMKGVTDMIIDAVEMVLYEEGFEEVAMDDMMARSRESDNVVRFYPVGWRRPVTIMGPGAGPPETVTGILAGLGRIREMC